MVVSVVGAEIGEFEFDQLVGIARGFGRGMVGYVGVGGRSFIVNEIYISKVRRLQLVYRIFQRPHTGWDRVFDHVEHRHFKTPVTLPVSHRFSCLEMLRQVVNSYRPSVHHDTTETAPRTNLRGRYLPSLHRRLVELDTMNKSKVLVEVIFSVKGPLFQ
jgi:hypothetical protein